MRDTTLPGGRSSFPDDELRGLLRDLVRLGGLLEPRRSTAAQEHLGLDASMSEVFALGELAEAGTLSQQDLADHLGLEKSTVSRLAAGLEQRGWIARERDPANRRFYRLALTTAGRDAALTVGEVLTRHHGELLARLTEDERRALRTGLTALMRAMSDRSG